MDIQILNLVMALRLGLITWNQYFEVLVYGKLILAKPKEIK